MSDKVTLCCLGFWVFLWLLGITISWFYWLGPYSNEADSTKDLALAGAILYTLSIVTVLKQAADSGCMKKNNGEDLCNPLCHTLMLGIAAVCGFVLPLIAGLLMAVGAGKASHIQGKLIAGTAAFFDFLTLPINFSVLGVARWMSDWMSDYGRV